MFIIALTYLKPAHEVDAALDAHRAFLRAQYDQGRFLVSGRKVPRDGGIIIARGASRAEIEALVQLDPFHQAGLASYAITEFVPTMTADELCALRED